MPMASFGAPPVPPTQAPPPPPPPLLPPSSFATVSAISANTPPATPLLSGAIRKSSIHTRHQSLSSPASSPRFFRKSPPPSGCILQPSCSRGPSPPARSDTATTTTSISSTSIWSDELPSNVCSQDQLPLLPPECLHPSYERLIHARPLRHVDEMGRESFYSLNPTTYSVVFILLIELLERFAFYGLNFTLTAYLTGAYDPNWNAGMDAVTASSYVSISMAVAYTTPFVGAILSDRYLGEYWTILTGNLIFYIPGLVMIALTTIPGLFGAEQFNRPALLLGLLVLWPFGTGTIKGVVNVFGARQYHPLLQASMIEPFYVNFYMCINIGALVGGFIVPLTAQNNLSLAYFLPVCALCTGVALFLSGTPRYVLCQPTGTSPSSSSSSSATTKNPDLFPSPGKKRVDGISLETIFRITMLVVPFNIAYSQMATTFIVQGLVMEKAFGYIDAATMNNADSVAVLVFGSMVASGLYPSLARHNIKIPSTYKFAIGSAFGVAALAWSLLIEYRIRAEFKSTGEKISILWQTMSYMLIGAGEIFAISAVYEVAFTAAPPEMKVLASAVNLLCIGCIPSVICIFLYNICKPWFENQNGTMRLTKLDDYASAHVDRYFWLLLVIACSGVWINVHPSIRAWVESIEEKATEMIKTPRTPTRPPRMERMAAAAGADEESTPLLILRMQRHEAYLKYGSGPMLIKIGSMRAGSSLSRVQTKSGTKRVKRHQIVKFYRRDLTGSGITMANGGGGFAATIPTTTNGSAVSASTNATTRIHAPDGTLFVAGAVFSRSPLGNGVRSRECSPAQAATEQQEYLLPNSFPTHRRSTSN